MNRNQIEYILAVAQMKNFRLAAESCFITQSTLSAMIAKFEQQNGVEIFNRKTRPISITPQGKKIISALESISREFQLLDETVNEIKGQEVGQLRIACIPTVAPYLYPLFLDKISHRYSKVNFFIHELTTDKVVEDIIAGNIDVGIVSIPLSHRELVNYPVYEEDFLLYDCAVQPRSSGKNVTDIEMERLWLLEEGHCLRNQVGKICELREQQKINGNITYSCGSIFTLIEMVKMNQGVTLLPRLALVNNKQIEKKYVYDLQNPVPARSIGLVTHKNFVRKRILSNLASLIKEGVSPYLSNGLSEKLLIEPF